MGLSRLQHTVSPVYIGTNLIGFVGGGLWISSKGVQKHLFDIVWTKWLKDEKPEFMDLRSDLVQWYFMNEFEAIDR